MLRSPRTWFEAALFALALGFAAAAAAYAVDDATANICYFGAWTAALLLLFSLALRLPVQGRGRHARLGTAALVVAALAVGVLGNVALYRHDVHFDATAEGRYTAPPQLIKIARHLGHDVTVTYFYNTQDGDAARAKDVLAAVAHRYPKLRVRALDLDKEIIAARELGVRMYNSAVVQFAERRTEVDNTVDLRDVAFAIERVLKSETPVVCFVTGHGETYNPQSHVHLGHREVMGGDGTTTIQAGDTGVDRLRMTIQAIGYSDRALTTTTATAVPADCALVADLGPRDAYSPAEVKLLRDYAAGGGRLLLMYDPEFPVSPELQAMFGDLGVQVGDGSVLDPVNHAGTEADKVAVPYYPPHPITNDVAMTVFPAPRPLRLLKRLPNVEATALVQTSTESYVQQVGGTLATLAATQVAARGPKTLALAMDGIWPGGGQKPFRLVLVGSAGFATNAFFPYVSNGDLAVSMVRWLAGDLSTPKLRPITYSLPEIQLAAQQMRATFVVVVILLPLSVILLGVLVWRRRR
ncbi:MAG: Gldg family protein [Acetobacteraceae bacterium]|nr:Gldg family protein [Acetobacteraceae bacterium]